MKKLIATISLWALSIVLVGQPCFAQEAHSMAVGGQLSYVMLQDNGYKVGPYPIDFSYDASLGGSINFTYFILSNFSLETSIGYAESDVKVDWVNLPGIEYGTLTQMPLLVTARYHIPVNEKVSPYIGGGIGYYFNDIDEGAWFKMIPPAFEVEDDDSYGYHLNAGVEVALTSHLSMNLDLKYSLTRMEMGFSSAAYPDVYSGSVDMDAYTTSLGIKYYF